MFTYAHPFPTLPRMSRRYAITKVLARSRVCLVRNSDPTAEGGSGNRKVARFVHDKTVRQRCTDVPIKLPSENRCIRSFIAAGVTRVIWPGRTPSCKGSSRALHGRRLGWGDRLLATKRMSSFGPMSAGRSPVVLRPTTGAVSCPSCGFESLD